MDLSKFNYSGHHNHTDKGSNGRMLDCIIRSEKLVDEAIRLGWSGVSCTDHESLAAHMTVLERYQALKTLKEKYDAYVSSNDMEGLNNDKEVQQEISLLEKMPSDFRLGLGNEIYLIDNVEETRNNDDLGYWHFILIAKDRIGYDQIKKISAESAWKNWFKQGKMARVPTLKKELEEIIGDDKGHIIASTACFVPGTKVETNTGWKSIEDLTSDDFIINHNGNYEKVVSTTERIYNGKFVKLQTTGFDKEIVCTEDHKFLTTNSLAIRNSKNTGVLPLQWKPASELVTKKSEKKDILVSPVKTVYTNNTKLVKSDYVPKEVSNSSEMKIPEIINLTPELMRLFGLFLGNGYITTEKEEAICFSFNKNEYCHYLIEFFGEASKQLNINWSVSEKETSVTLTNSSSELIYLFKGIFGDVKAINKSIPDVLRINKELDTELFYGYWLADGHYNKPKNNKLIKNNISSISFKTISERMARDFWDLLNSCGIAATICKAKSGIDKHGVAHRTSYLVTCQIPCDLEFNKLQVFNKDNLLGVFKLIENFHKKNFIHTDECDYRKIRIKSKEVFDGEQKVHCLNTESRTFKCEDVIVHNCLGSELDHYILKYIETRDISYKAKIKTFIDWCKSVFGEDNLFLEIQPCLEELPEDGGEIHEQILVNRSMFKLAEAFKLRVSLTTDSHYTRPEFKAVHEAFLNSDNDDNASAREVMGFYDATYMFTKQELYDSLKTHLTDQQIEKAFIDTEYERNLITDFDLHHKTVVPFDRNIPDFKLRNLFEPFYEKYPAIKNFAYSEDLQDRYLLYLIENGFFDELKENCDSSYPKYSTSEYDKEGQPVQTGTVNVSYETKIARINEELETFWEVSERLGQKISSYYVLVRQFVQNVLWKKSYVGVARGSVTGSYICYIIQITQINPLRYELPFWRHLHVSRPELPDIDIDTEAGQRQNIIQGLKDYLGEKNVLNTLTFRTLTSRAAVLSACRGSGIDNDEASLISSLVPFERGANWSFKDCFEGNEEKGRKPVSEFISEVKKFDGLKDILLALEGIVCGYGIHASSVYCFSNGYLELNGRMKAPNGTDVTIWNMTDSDKGGSLKQDFLTIQNLDMIHKTVDLLIEDGKIEDKGSIKANYDAYVHPKVLEYNSLKMWDMLDKGELINAFQFDTLMGSTAIKKIQPKSLLELAVGNTLMRLMAEDGAAQPIDEYVTYKNNIGLWYKEMRDFGLNDAEISLMEKHLKENYGVADSQESAMGLSMDENIANFTVAEANKLRKGIAKKKPKVIEEIRQLFYKKGQEAGTREILLDYVWKVQLKRQFGYSFSLNHTMPYSTICLQEMNLGYFYPRVYWNTACLICMAGALEEIEDNKTTNYGKTARAIALVQQQNQKVILPDINRAEFGFKPDSDTNEILFGLKAIQGIGDEAAKQIIRNRPYTSFNDFIQKMNEDKERYADDDKDADQVLINESDADEDDDDDEKKKNTPLGAVGIISLIKAGAFDNIETERNRVEIMEDYIRSISKPLKSLSWSNAPTIEEMGLITKEEDKLAYRFIKFKKYVCQQKFFSRSGGKSPSTHFYVLEQKFAEPFFFQYYEGEMQEGKDWNMRDDGRIEVKRGSIEKITDKLASGFKTNLLDNSEILEKVNNKRWAEIWTKRLGSLSVNLSDWEMDALTFYYHEHALSDIDKPFYKIVDFYSLPESPIVASVYNSNNGKQRLRFATYRICGTVLDKNKNKNVITLLTESGVVTVKFNKGQFAFYDKQISEIDPTSGKKSVVERSWFKRGTKLMLTGFRRDDQFVPCSYKNSIYAHSVQKITKLYDDGQVDMISSRKCKEES